jgi:hypothetical protein
MRAAILAATTHPGPEAVSAWRAARKTKSRDEPGFLLDARN